MPHTLLVSFSLLALVVTARPIAPVSDYSQPTEVQNAIKAIFEERTKQSNIDLVGLTRGEVDIHLISDERQQAVLSQLGGSAVKALVPLESTESNLPPEVQRLREMLGGSKHLDDIEGVSPDELGNDVKASAHAVDEPESSGLTGSITSPPKEPARVLTELSLTSLLAVYTLISLTAVLYTFYLIRGLLPQSRGEDEKQPIHPGDVESGYTDEKGTITQETETDLGTVPGTDAPRTSHPPEGVLVNIDEDIIVADDKSRGEIGINTSTPAPCVARPELRPVIEKPWLVPLPPSPTSSPPRRTFQLREDVPVNGSSQPALAIVALEEQHRPNARAPGNAPAAVDLALAMQLRTGFGATADAGMVDTFRDGSIRLDCRAGRRRGKTGQRKKAARVV
ncbi:hypothetical protein V8E52_011486, partial [Russula decolorans]